MPVVVLVGTLDTKGPELAFMRERIRAAGCQVILVDAGIRGPAHGTVDAPDADISADEVATAAGEDRAVLAAAADRGAAVMAMARGTTQVVQRLHAQGRLDGIAGIGGSGGTSIVSAAMRALPVGVPKLLVSTIASGDTRPFVGTSDITLMYSVVDIAGLNQLSERILANAAAAIAGMARDATGFRSALPPRPVIAATMYGVTTPCVDSAREWLEARGFEVLVFHATGSGGRAMESLVRSGFISAVLDVTTTELTDALVGGIFSAGPDRLEAAGALGLPQVVSVGATEMGTFGPPETVPARYRGRNLYRHNEHITLMRVTTEESAALGRLMARKLNASGGPVSVFVPTGGFSSLSVRGGPFHDPAADAALIKTLRTGLRAEVEVVEMATDVNDPAFAVAMARRLEELHGAARSGRPGVSLPR